VSRLGPCMCGATDCPSCGPAQGYTVVRRGGRWVNPEDDDPEGELPDDDDLDEPPEREERERNQP